QERNGSAQPLGLSQAIRAGWAEKIRARRRQRWGERGNQGNLRQRQQTGFTGLSSASWNLLQPVIRRLKGLSRPKSPTSMIRPAHTTEASCCRSARCSPATQTSQPYKARKAIPDRATLTKTAGDRL